MNSRIYQTLSIVKASELQAKEMTSEKEMESEKEIR